MKFTLKTPCVDCPFVRSRRFHLSPERVDEIEQTVGGGFPCHKTVDYGEDAPRAHGLPGPDEVHCAGSLILQWKSYEGFDGMVAFALGGIEGWTPETHLDLDADVFDDFWEMRDAMEDLENG